MKKHTWYLVTISLLIGAICPQIAKADAVLTASTPTTVLQGSTFNVNVLVSQAADLYGFQFDLGFNPAVLQATGFSEGTFLSSVGPTFFFNNGTDDTAGTVASNVDTLIGVPNGANGSGTLVSFDFLALAAGTVPSHCRMSCCPTRTATPCHSSSRTARWKFRPS